MVLTGRADVASVVRHLAAWGLPGGPDTPIAADVEVEPLVSALRFQRISGVARQAVSSGALDVDEAVASDIRLRLAVAEEEQLEQSLMAEADLVRLVRLLTTKGIDHRVLKGLATAHLDHHDPAERVTSDVDLLVRPDQLAVATDALRTLIDVSTTVPDRRRRHVERYGKDRTLHLASGGWLDLHRLIAPAYWGLSIDHTRFFERGEGYRVAGTEMVALARTDRLIHALLHAGYTDEVRAHSFRDVPQLVAALDIPIEQLLDSAWLTPVRGLLALGLRRSHEVLGIPIGLEWAAGVTPTRREAMALRTRRLHGRREHWAGSLALPLRKWPGYLAPLAFPSRAYLDFHGRSVRAHLAEAPRALRRRKHS